MVKNIKVQQALFFSFLKRSGLKNKKKSFSNSVYKNDAINIYGF